MWERMDRTVFLARALSLSALALCVAAFVAILLDGAAKAPASAGGQAQLERLEASAAKLARVLPGLGETTTARSVRAAIHRAVADNEAVQAQIKRAQAAGLPADTRLANAAEAQYEYLDALGSVLVNPRSSLRDDLQPRAVRARAALASVRDARGLPATVRGWQRVAAYASARRGE